LISIGDFESWYSPGIMIILRLDGWI